MPLTQRILIEAAERVDSLLRAGWLPGPEVMAEAVKQAAHITDPDSCEQWCDYEVELIAAHAPHRMWWDFLQQGFPPDYVAVLSGWSEITQGRFVPADATQSWTGEKSEPINLSFTWNGQTHQFDIPGDSDWLDLSLIFRLNRLFGANDHRFAHMEHDFQLVRVFYMSPEEIEFFRGRGWTLFATAEEVPAREPINWAEFFGTPPQTTGN